MASVFTLQMTSATTIQIDRADSVMSLSVQAAPGGGDFTIIGGYTFKGTAPTQLALSNGQGVTLFAPSTSTAIDGVTIEWVSGTVELVLMVQ